MADWLALEGAIETEQSPLGKLTAWASASDTKMADLAKDIQSAKKWMEWGFIILAALILFWKKVPTMWLPAASGGCAGIAGAAQSREAGGLGGLDDSLALWHRVARQIVCREAHSANRNPRQLDRRRDQSEKRASRRLHYARRLGGGPAI
jgi:hypothetical protein